MPTNLLLRNYKPSNAEKKTGKYQGDPTMAFDTFVVISRSSPLLVHWPDATLSPDDGIALGRLAENLTTLGRAEGWVHAEPVEQPAVEWNCVPSAETGMDHELVSVFCPDPATAFSGEHYPPPPDAKRLRKGLKPNEHLFDCPRWQLCLDTEIIHAERWPRVPGARWVSYARAADAFTKPAAAPPSPNGRHAQMTVARFLLDGPVLPLVTETLPVAGTFRQVLLRLFQLVPHRRKRGIADRSLRERSYSRVLSGKDETGQPLKSHDHAYYLPTAESDANRLDHVTVFAAAGFGPDELAALEAVRRLPLGEGETLQVRLVGLGRPEDFRCRLFGPARAWESVTPFVVTRHPKKRGHRKDSADCHGISGRPEFAKRVLDEECKRWLRRRPTLAVATSPTYTVLEHVGRTCSFRPLQFRRARRKLGDDGANRATAAFRLDFDREVAGPLCLGHASHFGLGLFLPAE
jgi:CRISPR-associated protein Csb2